MKYSIVLIIPLLFSACINAQTTFEIVFDDTKSAGKIDKVDMFDLSQKEYYSQPYESVVKFFFKKKYLDTYWIVFFSGEKRIRRQIWLDAGNVKIIAHADSFKLVIDTVFNSPYYYKSSEIFKGVRDLLKQKDTVAVNKLLLSEYAANAQNPFSIDVAERYLNINQQNKQRLKPLKELMDTYGEELSWFWPYEGVMEKLNKSLVENFINLKDFDFRGTDNKITKANFKEADNIVLDFWFLQCAGCIADHKIIYKNLNLLKEKKIELIGISTDDDDEPWQQYLLNNNYTWQNLQIEKTHELYSKLYLHSFPYYVILNKSGEIKAIYPSFVDVLAYFDIKIN